MASKYYPPSANPRLLSPAGDRPCDERSWKYPDGKRGTTAGYSTHKRTRTEPCPECLEARRSRDRELYRQKGPAALGPAGDRDCDERTRKFPNGKRGTTAGFNTHKRKGSDPCPECLEAQRAKRREYTNSNYSRYREKKLAYQAKYREKNRETLRKNNREYHSLNPQRATRAWEKRRARLAGLPTDDYKLEDITKVYGSVCYLCGGVVDLDLETGGKRAHVDHLIPISSIYCPGDVLHNVRWTHERCNLKKGDKTVEECYSIFPNMRNPYAMRRY